MINEDIENESIHKKKQQQQQNTQTTKTVPRQLPFNFVCTSQTKIKRLAIEITQIEWTIWYIYFIMHTVEMIE